MKIDTRSLGHQVLTRVREVFEILLFLLGFIAAFALFPLFLMQVAYEEQKKEVDE